MAGKKEAFKPFVGFHSFRQGAGPRPVFLAVQEVTHGYLCVEYSLGADYVKSLGVRWDDFPRIYAKLDEDPVALANWLVQKACERQATQDAILLLGSFIKLTPEQEKTMAAAKLAKKTGDAEALKAAAKSTPVKGGKAAPAAPAPTARKGNPEALAKARAAKAENTGPDNRKIKVLKKAHGAREGSKTAERYDQLIGCKTVQEALDGGLTRADVNYAVKQGIISVG